MACHSPLKARRQKAGLLFYRDELEAGMARTRGVDVLSLPCGKCQACRIERAQLWTLRIMHEASLHDRNGFLTLTYSDENLPFGEGPTLDKRDVQLFTKRARKGRSFRFFCVGEYGERTDRPHYHIITFGWLPEFSHQVTSRTWASSEVDDAWGLGNATVGQVSAASAAYVAGYVQKKLEAREYVGRAPVFTLMSQGIGRGWFERYASDLNKGYIISEGRKVRIPRYYKEKKGDLDPEWYLLQKLRAREFRAGLDVEENLPERLAIKAEVLAAKRKFFAGIKREPMEVFE